MNGIQTIMRAFVVVAISTWLVILKPTFAASDLSFDATNPAATTYSKLLSDLRNLVKDPKLKYGGTNVPVMAATFKKKYILVDLKGSEGGTITIALNLNNDIYVVGYLDKLNGNFRSHIFKDAPSDAKTDLFPEATGKNRLTINYKSSYADIESNAGVSSRARVGLGMYGFWKRCCILYFMIMSEPYTGNAIFHMQYFHLQCTRQSSHPESCILSRIEMQFYSRTAIVDAITDGLTFTGLNHYPKVHHHSVFETLDFS